MGWLYSTEWESTKKVQDHLIAQLERHYEVVDKASTRYGRNFYVSIRDRKTGTTGIFVALINGNPKSGFGYKDMDETMGPNIVDCPLRLLAATPFDETPYEPFLGRDTFYDKSLRDDLIAAGLETGGLYRTKWRREVRAYHAARKRRFSAGDRVTIFGEAYDVVDQVTRRGRKVARYYVRPAADDRVLRIARPEQMVGVSE
jgi:hypothetical protein